MPTMTESHELSSSSGKPSLSSPSNRASPRISTTGTRQAEYSEQPRSGRNSGMSAYNIQEVENEHILLDPFRAPSVVLYFRSCVIWDIWPSVLMMAGWATLLCLVDLHIKSVSLAISNQLLTVMGTVIGFIISYRTSSAYERYSEGRRSWSQVILCIRNLSRIVWLHVPTDVKPRGKDEKASDDEILRALLEKKTVINMLEAFAVSLKHYLRGEHGIYYADLYHLVCFLPKYNLPSSIPEPGEGFELGRRSSGRQRPSHDSDANDKDSAVPVPLPLSESADSLPVKDGEIRPPLARQTTSRKPLLHERGATQTTTRSGQSPLDPPQPLQPAYLPPKQTIFDVLPALTVFRSMWKGAENAAGTRRKKARYSRREADDNIPLEILWYLSSYWSELAARKIIEPPVNTFVLAQMTSMTEALGSLERILTTPLVFAYSVHLRLVIFGYLIFLPFQIISAFGYLTIPAVAAVAFVFLGFVHIGQEIENPFGYDPNDLDTDFFCRNIISKELKELTSWPAPKLDSFVFTNANMPLYPSFPHSTLNMVDSSISSAGLQRALRHRPTRIVNGDV